MALPAIGELELTVVTAVLLSVTETLAVAPPPLLVISGARTTAPPGSTMVPLATPSASYAPPSVIVKLILVLEPTVLTLPMLVQVLPTFL